MCRFFFSGSYQLINIVSNSGGLMGDRGQQTAPLPAGFGAKWLLLLLAVGLWLFGVALLEAGSVLAGIIMLSRLGAVLRSERAAGVAPGE
jgi:hypothetical protein